MTPEHLDDDALSATLDGEATPEEHAHVEACATCRARVDELRAAANAIGTPLAAVEVARREEAIAAALLALPTPLASGRRRQPPGWVLGAAAAVVALGILVPLVNRSNGSSADRSSSSAAADSNARSKALESPEAQDSSGAAGAAPLFASAPADLGPINGEGELRDRVLEALRSPAPDAPTSTTSAAAGSSVADPCLAELTREDPTLGAVRLDARAVVDGTPGRVLVFDAGGDPPTVRAFAVTDACEVLRSATFPAP
jgi:hypothetical protein